MNCIGLIRNMLVVVVAGLLFGAASIYAATVTWDGGGDGTNWINGVNWDTDTVPVSNVDDVTINGATLPVNLNATTRNLQSRIVILNNSTLTNGTMHFAEVGGSVTASNVTFANSFTIDNVARNMSFVNSTYFDNTFNQTWSFGNNANSGGLTIIGGNVQANRTQLLLAPAGSPTQTSTLLINGGSSQYHTFQITEFGFASFANGTSVAIFTNTGVRITSSGSWGGGNAGSSTLVNLYNSTVRLDDGINLRTNLVLRTQNSSIILNTGQNGLRGLNNLMTSASKFDGEGLTINATTEQTNHPMLEVAGRVPVSGVTLSQFHDNYSIDHLIFGSVDVSHTTPRLYLKDNVDNDGVPGAEALFTDKITYSTNLFNNTFTLKTGGLNIYYKKLVTNGKSVNVVDGGQLIQVTGANLESVAPYTWKDGGDAAVAMYGGPTLTLTNPSDYGTVIVTNAPAAGDLFIRLNVSGNQSDINALAADIGANQVNGDLVLDYSRKPDGNNQFFDWSFAYRNVTVNSVLASAIPEPSSVALMLGTMLGALFIRRSRRS